MKRLELALLVALAAALATLGCADDAGQLADGGPLDQHVVDTSADSEPDARPDAAPRDKGQYTDTAPGGDAWRDHGIAPHPDIQLMSETVTCTFTGATGQEACRTSYFGPACQGKGSCTHKLSGYVGQNLTWHSSCGGSAATVMDGKDEAVSFACAAGIQATDTVTCRFVGASTKQSCSSIKGSCQGTTSCTVSVTANQGAVLDWVSSCGGRRALTVDGKDDQASFTCGKATATETVTCEFKGSTKQQSCTAASLPGYPECKGVGSCSLKVSGYTGLVVTWKSSCKGYAYTVIDGVDQKAGFVCK